MDEEITAENLGYLFPKSPVGTLALRERAAAHFNALASHLLQRSVEPEIRNRAEALRVRAARMAGAGSGLGCTGSQGPAKSLEEMDAAVDAEVARTWRKEER
jgi:hypothetical protein